MLKSLCSDADMSNLWRFGIADGSHYGSQWQMMSTTASETSQTLKAVAQAIATQILDEVGLLLPHVGLASPDKKTRSLLHSKLVVASQEWVKLCFALQAQCSEATWVLSNGVSPTDCKLCVRCGMSVKRGGRLQVISPLSTVSF